MSQQAISATSIQNTALTKKFPNEKNVLHIGGPTNDNAQAETFSIGDKECAELQSKRQKELVGTRQTFLEN
jgi:hypothetical protein